MRTLLCTVGVLGLLASGCTYVSSTAGGNMQKANDAWFVETTWVLGIPTSTRVYYCPPVAAGGAATCLEAEMLDKAPPATPTPATTPPPSTNPPSAPPTPDKGGGEGESFDPL